MSKIGNLSSSNFKFILTKLKIAEQNLLFLKNGFYTRIVLLKLV